MGFGAEMLFMMFLGLVLLGPKQLHSLLGHVARVKAEFDKASRGIKSQLAAELAGASSEAPAETRLEVANEPRDRS
jgi:Sec-independent protein translocase protein TatA